MTSKIKQALKAAGYFEDQPTEANLIECYLDYLDAYGGSIEEAREAIADGFLTVEMMCRTLIKCG
jgi:hypothetical protein